MSRIRYVGLNVGTLVLASLLAVSVGLSVLLTTVRFSITLSEPLSLGNWSPPLPTTSFPGQVLDHSNTLSNVANVQYKVLYRLNVTAEAGVFGQAKLYINGTEVISLNYDGNTTVKQGNRLINPNGIHNILLRIQTDPAAAAGKDLNVTLVVERLAPP